MKPSDVRILAVDDDPMMLEALARLFQTFQFFVDAASSGNRAWTLLQEKDYNLVVTDLRMPDGDGLELLKKIKARNSVNPSVLFISGFSDVTKEEVYHLGVEGLFAKPFDTKSVRAAIQTSLLTPAVRWANPIPEGKHVQLPPKKGDSIEELASSRSVLFGRGGFFFATTAAPFEIGTRVVFSIEIESPTPLHFKGVACVRWVQLHPRAGAPAGMGLEITHMETELAKSYTALFGDLIPFIPSPRHLENI